MSQQYGCRLRNRGNLNCVWTRCTLQNFLRIIYSDGKILFSEHREGVTNLLTPEESKKSLEMAMTGWKIRNELSHKIGKGRYVLAEYDKIKRITMPFGDDYLLYVTTEIEADHFILINQIRKLEAGLKYSN